ncbi:major tail protein [Gordonia phage IDyn]|uniref:Major tail protein n=2 Tax=Sukkupivirus TaxID=2948917 RepID=A0A5Q2WIZ4_9CAUD|nr:major tail protein [Gordonia phage IDyn]YP_010104616.1 major tail protein [Gordonia phage Sukkupi]QAU07086.1 major tail protein [Gordonia phage BiPauneto]QGH80753.1 major tail protein [Gordonia phage Yndexa]QAY17384.1 major tail protein [Gordonia phage IDyn]QGH79280.1 major tail protein [Gordonia phage Sukkupi]
MPSFAALAKRQGELIRKPLAGIIGVAPEDTEIDADFKLTVLTGGAIELADLSDFDQLGWVSKSDGVVFSADTETSDVESWGALEPTRSDITKDVTSAQFTCQETNKTVLEMFYNVDLDGVLGEFETGEIAFNQSIEPTTTYRRMIFLSKDGSGTKEVFIGKLMPRASVTAKSDQNWNSEDALVHGMTIVAKVDDELGYAVRHMFGGAGWKSQLTKMGFTLAPAPTP